jgi:hypothetical protein
MADRIVYGLDFTSAPRPRKPITCAVCTFDGAALCLDRVDTLDSFVQFEALLQRPGPWIAGFDFPFGQPAALIDALGWGDTWAAYVGHIAQLGKQAFEEAIAAFRAARPPGEKHLLRRTDLHAQAVSPMMLHGVPVGKMFFQGAPRLLHAGLHVVPCHPTGDGRVALEAYPALVARRWTRGRSYKSDTRRKQTAAHRDARQAIVAGLHVVPCHPTGDGRVALEAYPALVARRWTRGRSYKSDTRRKQTAAHRDARQAIVAGLRAACRAHYGFALALSDTQAAALVDDPRGDTLDAVSCAVQAAWASTQPAYGVPPDADPREGWIAGAG